MTKEFSVLIEKDADGYYVGSVPELKGCHSQAKSLDELMERMKDAIQLCIEDSDEHEKINFIGVQRISVIV
jgi:predicted RNase H-like HicB family nuclease